MGNTVINTPELLNLDSTTGATVLAKGTVNERPPVPTFGVDYLVVAGGGGASGGSYNAQGGGGGGYLTGALSISINTSYALTVGNGGAGSFTGAGTNGDNSVFSSIISPGGGGGGSGSASTGGSGGSGGAGSIQGGTGLAGFNGGVGDGINGWVAGGGGGAGAVGGSISGAGNTWYAGDGGNGATPSIITAAQATSVGIGEVVNNVLYLAGGGAGGAYNYPGYSFSPGSGGLGGGGDGSNSTNGTSGLANTGGGGGGGNSRPTSSGGAGGSGVVVLKYPNTYTITVGSGINEASGSPFTDGSDKISVYTGGTGTISFSGTVVGADSDATDGALRFNTDTNKIEYFDGANWYEIVDEYASGFVGPATNYFDTKLYTGNGAAQSIGGYINGSASFNGSSSKIDLGNNSSNNTATLSVSLWFKTAGHSATAALINNGGSNSGETGYYLGLNSNGTIKFEAGTGTVNGAVNYADSNWHQIVLTLNSGAYNIYVDGNTTPVITGSGAFTTTATRPTWIGQFSYTPSNIEFFEGSIDQVRLYNTALSASDVAALNLETAVTATTAAFPSGQTAIATYTMDTSANGLLNTQDLSTVDYPAGAGCLALYEMNGNSNDTSETYNGTPTNISYQGGAFDQAAVFGSSSNILLPSNLISGTTDSDYSVSLWVKFDTLPGANFVPLIGQLSNTSAFRLLLYYNSGSTYNVALLRTFGGTYYYNSSNTGIQGTFNVNQYYNVIVTYQSSNKLVNGYLNGNSIGSYTLSASGSGAAGAPALGTYNGTTSYSFDGSIDQVRIFNTVLTQSHVTTLARGIAASYSGAATNVNFNGHLDFAPDFTWLKCRVDPRDHRLFDTVRGATKGLYSNLNNVEFTENSLIAFNTNGFSLGSAGNQNVSNEDYVSWNWKAGGTAVTNNDGTIASQVSVNKDSGFSIVKYTGNATVGATVGHGLY
jgi:hypothetical protein